MTNAPFLFPFLLMLLVFGSAIPAAEVAAEPAHRLCADCHGEGNSLRMAPATLLCITCHPSNRTDHPLVAVPPDMPATLPLDNERKMTCLTCHDQHGEGQKMLRKPKDLLCQDCHQK